MALIKLSLLLFSIIDCCHPKFNLLNTVFMVMRSSVHHEIQRVGDVCIKYITVFMGCGLLEMLTE